MIYSVQLYRLTPGGGHTLLYTAPATGTIVIRDIRLMPVSPDPGECIIDLSGNGIASSGPSPVEYVSYGQECRIVMKPGDTINCSNLGGIWDVTISGYQLE